MKKTPEQWRQQLDPETFRVTREKGTEPAFSGTYNRCAKTGVYHCSCCGEALFISDSKYDSGCGWPSFTAPANDQAVDEYVDNSHGMSRTEVTCHACDAHLGHVFPDGPAPTGLRYCINSVSLELHESKED